MNQNHPNSWHKTEENPPEPSTKRVLEGWGEGQTGLELWRCIEETLCLYCHKDEEDCQCDEEDQALDTKTKWLRHEGDITVISLERKYWNGDNRIIPIYWRDYISPE